MDYFVYVIQSDVDASYYKGHTVDYYKRLVEHNNGESHYTARKFPWRPVYLEIYPSKGEAIIRERRLKKYSNGQIRKLIDSPGNKCRHLVDEWLKSIPTKGGD